MRAWTLPITVLFSLALVAMLGISVPEGDSYTAATEAMCLLLLWVPAVLAYKDIIHLPWPIVLGIALTLSLHSLGLVTNWYNTTFWWDKITHLTSGIVIASFVATMFVLIVQRTPSVRITVRWFPFLILISILTLEAFWEIMEFSVDHTLGTTMQHGLEDTANDILTNAVSGILAGLGVALYLSRSSVDEYISGLRADKIIRWLQATFEDHARSS